MSLTNYDSEIAYICKECGLWWTIWDDTDEWAYGHDCEPKPPTTKRELFEREIDNSVKFLRIGHRPRCKEWIAFSERFVERYTREFGNWVADVAIQEWIYYLQVPEGEYQELFLPEGWNFRAETYNDFKKEEV